MADTTSVDLEFSRCLMNFEELSIAWPFFLASFIAGGTAIRSRNVKRTATALYFTLCVGAASYWSFVNGLHLIMLEIEPEVLLSNATYVGIPFLPLFWAASKTHARFSA